MTKFTTHTVETAPEGSKPILEMATQKYGYTPNLLANMAEAPAMIEAYVTLSQIFQKTKLSETERQVILLTINRLNECTYCMAAHTTIAQMAKVDIDVIEALRTGKPLKDPKLEALRSFATVVNDTRGYPSEAQIEGFLAAGYTRQTMLEVIVGISLKVLSNYTNHLAGTEPDEGFKPNAWSPDMSDEEHEAHRQYAIQHYLSVDFWRGRAA